MLKWLQGKKTYLTGLAVGIIAVLKYYGVGIPEGVLELLAGFGLISLRSGVERKK